MKPVVMHAKVGRGRSSKLLETEIDVEIQYGREEHDQKIDLEDVDVDTDGGEMIGQGIDVQDVAGGEKHEHDFDVDYVDEEDPETSTEGPEQEINVEDVHAVGQRVETESGGKRKGRGPTTLSHVLQNNSGVRMVVKYNSRGQPIGPVAQKLSSYLGALARSMVPISYKSWPKVPKELKEKLWNRTESLYEVDPKSKKKTISAIGEKWRTFKTNLTRWYVTPFKDQPEHLTHPPKVYSFIKEEHWDQFVRSRLSPKFQDLSKLQKERRAKNKYNHRLSKKGYAGLEEELKQAGISDGELDRSVLWKKARQNKSGQFDNEAIKEKANQIDELQKRVDEGGLIIEGSRDILTLALGNQKQSGGVRAIVKSVTPIMSGEAARHGSPEYLDALEEKQRMLEVKLEEEMESRKQQADELLQTKQMVRQLQEQLKMILQQGSHTAPSSEETTSDIGKTLLHKCSS